MARSSNVTRLDHAQFEGREWESLSKSEKLRYLLTSPELEFIMEAHNGLSAKIVEEAEFKGIWASGLSMSAAMGVRDNNEASWTQVLEVLEFMADETNIPILVDGDTGYGNFNNLRRVVRKFEQRGIAGVCIEDKLFPKTNSFIGENQPLADIDEFCGKIKAGKDSQNDDNFSIIARVEALIAGWGMDEALKRADAYRKAGADAILIHSKKSSADEILAFAKEWAERSPLVIVPTKYYATPTEKFREANISVAIWANHTLRAAIGAMREVTRRVQREESLSGVENEIASVQDVFELAGNWELAEAEKRYLPKAKKPHKAIVLAASRGEELGEHTEELPKCMINVGGQPLLREMVKTFNREGIRDIHVVRGYGKDAVNLPAINTVDNEDYATTGEAYTLACAIDRLKGKCIIAYGDILFRRYILAQLKRAEADIVLAVDGLWREKDPDTKSRTRDLVTCSAPYDANYLSEDLVSLEDIGPDIAADKVNGEWIGLMKVKKKGAKALRKILEDMREDGTLKDASMIEVIKRVLEQGHAVSAVYVPGHWLDVDNPSDLREAQKFV